MATLIGIFRIGRDAELRCTGDGEPVCNLNLAYSHGKRDDAGNRPTQWVEASLWGKLARELAEYLTKGREVYAHVDDIHIESYEKKDGEHAAKLTGRCGTVQLVGSRPDSAAKAAKPAAPAPAGEPGDYAKAKGKAAKKPKPDDSDNGIPF